MDSVDRRPRNRTLRPTVEGLEDRQLMAAAVSDVAMVSATTADSRGVTFRYDVGNADLDRPVRFGVYRSADATLDGSDSAVGSLTVVPPGQPGATADQNGRPAGAVGPHTVTLPLPGGLPIAPKQPFVLVVADADHALPGEDRGHDTATFRKHVVGVITHGGVQPKEWSRGGPPWERAMARQLTAQGYDAVIPYNWVARSHTAGAAAAHGPALAGEVARVAGQFPASDPVDVHFIGHSEGAVVNSEALLQLNRQGMSPALNAGYKKVTMLDPHAANNNLAAKQYSVSGGLFGWLARQEINKFQSKAKDPLPVVPANTNEAEVFFQHTPAKKADTHDGVYNLWGQVPVQGQAHYYDLTAPGVSHSGKFGVQDWYRLNVVPTLAAGEPAVRSGALSGEAVGAAPHDGPGGDPRQPVVYAGKAAPGTTVRLLAGRTDSQRMTPVARGTAGADGTWTLTTQPLLPNSYRVVAVSGSPRRIPGHHRSFMRPTAWLGALTVAPPRPTS